MKLDRDTQKVLEDAAHVEALLASDGWRIIEASLVDKLIDMQSVLNVDDTTPEKALADMKARAAAVKLIKEWLQADVYGFVQQQKNLQTQMTDKLHNTFIDRG